VRGSPGTGSVRDRLIRIRPMTRGRVVAARLIAIAADLLQIAVFPAFSEGGVSPFDAGLDVAVAALLTGLVGWHWAFLPSFAAEIVPLVDLVPTWTAAVLIATRPSRRGQKPHPSDPSGEGKREARVIDGRVTH